MTGCSTQRYAKSFFQAAARRERKYVVTIHQTSVFLSIRECQLSYNRAVWEVKELKLKDRLAIGLFYRFLCAVVGTMYVP